MFDGNQLDVRINWAETPAIWLEVYKWLWHSPFGSEESALGKAPVAAILWFEAQLFQSKVSGPDIVDRISFEDSEAAAYAPNCAVELLVEIR